MYICCSAAASLLISDFSSAMRSEPLNGKCTSRNTSKSVLLFPFALLLIMLPLLLMKNSHQSSWIFATILNSNLETKPCDIFSGKWVPYSKGPYYENETCPLIIDQQNCMKFGRPDREFLHWRWKPDECVLPLFDATRFLKLVRGKSMAFLGDSVGRNQMQSLLCLLNHVAHPEDISVINKSVPHYLQLQRWFYPDYNFTLAALWSPYLVRARDADRNGYSPDSLMDLYVDKVDETWPSEVENFDYVIISAGHWFPRPLVYYENDQLVGCHRCGQKNITELTHFYGFRKAFRTAFRTIMNLKGYKGVTFLRTFSPGHFENGEWNTGGSCVRTKPFTKEQTKLDGFVLETYLTQVEEFRAAQREARKRGLQFLMLDTTEIMLQRPDGHPNIYGHPKDKNLTAHDCVHWCLPGPIDTWNELLLYMLKMESQTSFSSSLRRFF